MHQPHCNLFNPQTSTQDRDTHIRRNFQNPPRPNRTQSTGVQASDADASRDPSPNRPNSSNFNMSTFHKVIPSYDGRSSTLNIFLNRCDTYYNSLNALGQIAFLENIIYKLDDTAHIIYKSKRYTSWKALRKDLSQGIAEQKSLTTLQTELLALRQRPNQSVGDFSDVIRKKLNILTDKVKEISESLAVQETFQRQNDQMACRALKEGLHPALRQRLIVSPESTFEKLRQFALEEEPYTRNTSNSERETGQSNASSNPRYTNNYNDNQYHYQQNNRSNNYARPNNQNPYRANGYNQQNGLPPYNAPAQNRYNYAYDQRNRGYSNNQPQYNDANRDNNRVTCNRCGRITQR